MQNCCSLRLQEVSLVWLQQRNFSAIFRHFPAIFPQFFAIGLDPPSLQFPPPPPSCLLDDPVAVLMLPCLLGQL